MDVWTFCVGSELRAIETEPSEFKEVPGIEKDDDERVDWTSDDIVGVSCDALLDTEGSVILCCETEGGKLI